MTCGRYRKALERCSNRLLGYSGSEEGISVPREVITRVRGPPAARGARWARHRSNAHSPDEARAVGEIHCVLGRASSCEPANAQGAPESQALRLNGDSVHRASDASTRRGPRGATSGSHRVTGLNIFPFSLAARVHSSVNLEYVNTMLSGTAHASVWSPPSRQDRQRAKTSLRGSRQCLRVGAQERRMVAGAGPRPRAQRS